MGGDNIKKYKDTYKVIQQKDLNGKPTTNRDDTYIPCAKGVEIYRYNQNTLAVSFCTSQYTNNRINDLKNVGVILTKLQLGNDESTYLFPESDLEKVADIVKARKRKQLSDEQKEKLRQRILDAREKLQKRA
jgi:viroplasmin and RNaseH domain-containing protein